MNITYYLGLFISIPLLPIMFIQGLMIRAKVPKLPEAEGAEGTTYAPTKTAKNLKLVTIGESTIAGVGVDTHEKGFTGGLAAELSRLLSVNVPWKVYARSGYTARNVVQDILPSIQEKNIDLFVVGLGGNDAFTLNRPSSWRKHIRLLISHLQTRYPDSPIVFCNMPPIKEFPAFTPLIKFTIGNLVEMLGRDLSKVVQEYDNVFYFGEVITLEGWIDKLPPGAKKLDFFSDGVHPSRLTYQTWAKDIANHIVDEVNQNLGSVG